MLTKDVRGRHTAAAANKTVPGMITRIWHGRTKRSDADKYLQFLLGAGTKEYLETPGNLSAKIWRHKSSEACHFWTVTDWTDLESIRDFAGADYEKAKYYPEDDGILLEFEEKVLHYECFEVSNRRVRGYILQLEQLFNGESWQGESFPGKLDDVDEKTAFIQPAGVHSIAEIVWHCIYWRTVLLKRVGGDKDYRDRTMKKMNFLSVKKLQEKGWQVLVSELNETQGSLLEFLRTKNDNDLSAVIAAGDSLDHMLEGIVHHDLYHLGQIGLVKKMVKNGVR